MADSLSSSVEEGGGGEVEGEGGRGMLRAARAGLASTAGCEGLDSGSTGDSFGAVAGVEVTAGSAGVGTSAGAGTVDGVGAGSLADDAEAVGAVVAGLEGSAAIAGPAFATGFAGSSSSSTSNPSNVANAPPTVFLPIELTGNTAILLPNGPATPSGVSLRVNLGKMGFSSPSNAERSARFRGAM